MQPVRSDCAHATIARVVKPATVSRLARLVPVLVFAIIAVWPGGPSNAARPGAKPGSLAGVAGLVFVNDAGISVNGGTTIVRLTLSRCSEPRVFSLGAPYRVIIDLPNAVFRLPEGLGRTGRGLVSAFRYGLLTPLKSRFVIDTSGPVSIKAVRMLEGDGGRSHIVLEIVAVPKSAFVAQGRDVDPPPANTGLQGNAVAAPSSSNPYDGLRKGHFEHARHAKPGRKPVIVIDPGHGGPDPGAVGRRNTYEKAIALAVGRKLQRQLQVSGRFQVIMTRTRDIFVSLEERVQLSAKVGADLFISLHADAIEQASDEVRGATVYTLSGRASDEQARRFADKENASDVLAGFPLANAAGAGKIESILIDLMRRETQSFSHALRDILVRALRAEIVLARDPRRAAAFKVLKQTQTPSVLVELGYISNPRDEQQMRDPRWQSKAVKAIASAVARYFATKRNVMR